MDRYLFMVEQPSLFSSKTDSISSSSVIIVIIVTIIDLFTCLSRMEWQVCVMSGRPTGQLCKVHVQKVGNSSVSGQGLPLWKMKMQMIL